MLFGVSLDKLFNNNRDFIECNRVAFRKKLTGRICSLRSKVE